jgi:hypothetical protein
MGEEEKTQSYFKLLNYSALGKRRAEEVAELIATMKSLGYEWAEKTKRFNNSEINHSVRVQDLDLFTARSFKKYHRIINIGYKNHSMLIKKMDNEKK